VHGKGSLIGRMPGDDWQQFANLRLLFACMWSHPGKKLLFMGGELGQRREWAHEQSLEWHVLGLDARHEGVQKWVADLNHLYRREKALHEKDFSQDGFAWISRTDWEQSVIAFQRRAADGQAGAPPVVVVCNFTPVARHGYRVGVPCGGQWQELLNSDAQPYGGSGVGNFGGVHAEQVPYDGHEHSVSLSLPPLGAIFLKPA
jgi:1,4-alpha-glucan branching enzyme